MTNWKLKDQEEIEQPIQDLDKNLTIYNIQQPLCKNLEFEKRVEDRYNMNNFTVFLVNFEERLDFVP